MKKERGRVEGFYILYKLLQLKNDLFLTRFIIYWLDCKLLLYCIPPFS